MKVRNKKIIIAFSLLVFLGILVPFKSALAWDIFSFIRDDIVGNFTKGIVWALSGIFAYAASFLLETGQSFLAWVISGDFMGSVSMTNNPIVNYGWAITRDMANIFLLLGLVVIGLGIILGLEEYQAKKTIPRMLAMALLINFTPVICGFFIDFSNTLMNYLLGGGTLPQNLYTVVVEGINQVNQTDPYSSLLIMLVWFIFGFAGFLAYVLYGLLFIFRYIFLWILIIFSPIAFVSNIFPSDKIKNFFPDFFQWQEWWKQFLSWCAIGIYAAFFILLASKLMVGVASNTIGISEPAGKLATWGKIFSYVFPLILLFIGIDSVKKIVEQKVPGAGKVMGLAQTAGIAAVTAGAGLAVGVAAGVSAGATVGASRGAQEGVGTLGKIKGTLKGAAMGGATAGGREEGAKWYRKTAEKVPYLGPKPGTYEAELRGKTAEEEKRLDKLDKKDLNYLAQDKTVLTREGNIRRAAALNILNKRGELDETNTKYVKEAQSFGFNAEEAAKKRPSIMAEKIGKNTEDVVKGMDPEEFRKSIHEKELENIDVFASMDLRKLQEIGAKGSSKKIDAVKTLNNKTVLDNKQNEFEAKLAAAKTSRDPQEIAKAQARLNNFKTLRVDLTGNPNFQ